MKKGEAERFGVVFCAGSEELIKRIGLDVSNHLLDNEGFKVHCQIIFWIMKVVFNSCRPNIGS